MSYVVTVTAIDSRLGTPIAGAFVTVTFRLAVGIPPPVPKTGTTGIDGRVSWTTAREGITDITATHTDYDDWRSIFNFSPTNPTANIFMQSLVGPVMSEMAITSLDDATGQPIVDTRVTVDWAGVGGRFLEGKTTDINGVVIFKYWPSWAGSFDVKFAFPSPIILQRMLIAFPPDGGSKTISFILTESVSGDKEKEEPTHAIDMTNEERLAMAILAAFATMQTAKVIEAVVPG